MLYVLETKTREVKDLSGIWRFKVDWKGKGLEEGWYGSPLRDTIPMPVPSSYNDVTQDPKVRDHVGTVWYEREFTVPLCWKDKRVFVRVGAAAHRAIVFVNGRKAVEHEGGVPTVRGGSNGSFKIRRRKQDHDRRGQHAELGHFASG